MYLRIEYYDQNFSFASCLPRDGKVIQILKSSESDLDWYLLDLIRPILYNNSQYRHLLLASRDKAHFIGDDKPVHVFIRLVPSENIANGFSYKQYQLVAWGIANLIPDQPLVNGLQNA